MNIVIVGAGDIGRYMATILSKDLHNVIVIDKDKAKLDELAIQIDVATRLGSGTDWQLLDDLLELMPNMLIALTNDDETNLVSCSIAKHLGYPYTVCRVRDSRYLNRTRLDFARLFDVDHFIAPEVLVAYDILEYMLSQGSVAIEYFAHGSVQLRTLLIPSTWKKGEIPLSKLTLPAGVMVGLIKRSVMEEQPVPTVVEKVIFPHGNDVLQIGDEVTFIGETDAVSKLHEFIGIEFKPIESVVIVGGSLSGVQLAKLLNRRNIPVKLIEKDYNKCVTLSETLQGTTIIHHDATDPDFLRSEKIDQADIFISATRHDEVNVLCAMLAKDLGCQEVIAILSNTSYRSVLAPQGIKHVVSPRITAANQILSKILTGTVTTLVSLYDNQAEVMEINVSMESKVAGIPLSELGPMLPKDFLIAMIQNRGRIMVAKGDRIISPGDTVIVVTTAKHVPELEKIF